MKAIVLGGGAAGLAASLALARGGHQVELVDKEAGREPAGGPEAAFADWQRPGIPQFRQPHNFLGLGRRVLRDRAPDVYQDLLRAGAGEVDQTRFVTDGTREPGDEDLATLACRRPVFDAVLQRAVSAEPGVTVRAAKATGLVVTARPDVQVRGVRLEGGAQLAADLLVDAMGRGSATPDWLHDEGAAPITERVSECGLVYYSRHYRLRDGAEMPPYASVLAGPRGDLGYLAYATFLGDNRTFCLCIMIPPWDRELRSLRDPTWFDRTARLLPGMAEWVDPAVAESITPILPMGQLRNLLRHTVHDGRPIAPGLVIIGDALCHTNPTFAFGASLSLSHAFTLADVLGRTEDPAAASLAFHGAVAHDVRDRFEAVTAEDRDRARLWGGEPLDVTDPEVSMPLFLRSVVYRVAPVDSRILRAAVRRIDLLDPPGALPRDTALLQRASELFRRMRDAGAFPPPAPSRPQLLDAVAA